MICQDYAVTRLLPPTTTTTATTTATTASTTTATIGILQVKRNSNWGTVCDDSFGPTEAQVACRSLGYERGVFKHYPGGHLGPGTGDILLDEPNCKVSNVERKLGEMERKVGVGR
ncbi:Galectin-3-binding protein A [Portunus trituberculatus]|uniref:Galectin-3-binding protein A n=1 Tax=Portunus trituberculatus TaxID=210409 RepID=A0A5B7KCM7_PORTR|nr:Galectin-3-binding protein A [Portunus trituberculatus]